ncbi:unnamed protein product [Ceratitis capitata]|uniref:(Mediterranean fruit fly) hypothetical protein n=1 Tax=Ceratitis capitata TaxID=7213 RepID=A0A811TXF0_CERCA|nr:unnamed protein product [Ceratitis capitata]
MLSKKSVVIFATLLAYCHANAVASTDETNVNGNEDQEEACPVVCPALYAPTCGFDGADYQEFVNPCMLQVTNCARRKERALKKPFAKLDIDWCKTKQIDNLYDFLGDLAANLDKPECLRPCPMIFDPVCITNGDVRVTIATACQLDMYNCALKAPNWVLISSEY